MKNLKRIYIEITNICNLSCSFCPKSNREQSFISIEDFKTIINKIKGYTNYVYLHVKGEPLLHPNILEFLEICDENNIKLSLTTNGTLLQSLKEELINSKSVKQISISLQSFEEDNIDKCLEYMKDVIDFVKYSINNRDIIIELRLWNIINGETQNINNLNRIKLDYLSEGLGIENIQEKITIKGQSKVLDKVHISQAYEFKWPDINIPDIESEGYCYGLTHQIAILTDGTVVPCCLDQEGIMNLGNIYKEELDEILSSKRAKNIKNGFRNKKLVEPLCRKCGFRTRFKYKYKPL